MDFLPNEIIYHIFSFLKRNKLLSIRIVSRKWNTFSLELFNSSNLNIGFRNNDEVKEFCEMMEKNNGGLKFQKFHLRLRVTSKYVASFLNWNWTQLSNEMSSYVTEYYFFIGGDCEEQSETINMMLNNALNLKILYIHTYSTFPNPNLSPLKKLEVLQLESYELNSLVDIQVDLEIVVNWIEKAPSLKKLDFQLNISGKNSSEISKYFQYLQRIPEVSMYVYLHKDHEKQLSELSLIPITKLRLEIVNANGDEVGRALNLFLKKQSGRLKNLQIESISKITNLLLPSLPKMETFIIFENENKNTPPGNFLTFDPKNFINLRRVMVESLEPFIGGVYPTVTKLVCSYSIQNWRNIFPNLRKFSTFFYDSLPLPERLEMLQHMLANLPTDHHLKLRIKGLEMIQYLIVNPSSVAKLEINLHNWDWDGEKRKEFWNTLTGHARVEHDSILCIEGVNSIGIPQEMGIQPSVLNIKNLYKLRVCWLSFGEDFLKAISFLAQQKESFKALKKMIITVLTGHVDLTRSFNRMQNEQKLLNNYKKFSTWNFNTEIRMTPIYRSLAELTWSREKMSEIMMYHKYIKYAV